ncbi:hypothetical protein [Macrococcoides caseolyticum]
MDYEVKGLKESVYAEHIEHVSLTDDSLGMIYYLLKKMVHIDILK